MRRSFADTSFLLALINKRDKFHARARALADGYSGELVTTHWVLVEVADALSRSADRPTVLEFLRSVEDFGWIDVVGLEEAHFRYGLELFGDRPDKDWSLTDCISFALMHRMGLIHALSFDHHFEQAGFVVNAACTDE